MPPAKPSAAKPRAVLLSDYKPSDFVIDRVDLTISLDPSETRVKSKMMLRRNLNARSRKPKPLVLDGEMLTLASVSLDGTVLASDAYRVTDRALTIFEVPAEPFRLEITTLIDPDGNTALQGIYRSRGVYCSQCEAQGFRRITYFLDRPDVLSVYTVRLEADRKTTPILLANGNLKETGTVGRGNRHYAVWHDPHPKPSYLFAVVGGDLGSIASTFKTMSGRNVDLRIYVEHGKEDRAHWAMDSLKRSMAWDEKRFGREYDLECFNIVAVSDFNMGAMENKGLNIFNDRLILASPKTTTDASYEAIESVVAHEYFHNWTGNRITCRDWFQLCLKEGLTVFRDQEFSSDERSRTVQRISDVRQLKALQFPEDQGPLAHAVRPESYIEINNFYTPTVYEKGAELVRMIATILGEDGFRAGMDLYFERHDGDAATIEDFITCFEDASGIDLKHFSQWYSQAGTPELVCDFRYDRPTKSAELTIHQSQNPTPGQSKKPPLFIPVRVGMLSGNGDELRIELDRGDVLNGNVLAVSKARQTFRFRNLPSRPVPSLLRGFSAPVNLTMDIKDRDLAFLMVHDSDLFNRWQAANRYATRAMLKRLSRKTPSKSDQASSRAYADALRATLADPELEDAYKAELLKMPSQSDLAREKGSSVDPSRIEETHREFSSEVCRELGDALEELYAGMKPAKTFSPDAAETGKRALRNAALTLFNARGEPGDLEKLEKHYRTSKTMTDTAHALVLIAGGSSGKRSAVLKNFFETWKDDHLVIDIWFSAQAQSPRNDTLETVKDLTGHPLFRFTTPNKVRALVGAFAMSNPVQFNRPDGAGYDFVTDMVLEVDKINPQVSARLLSAFRSYRSLEKVRQNKARAALQKVADTKSVSKDAYEIISRMLDG